MTLDMLLGALRGIPKLDGARCVQRSHLFDPPTPRETAETVAARHTQALSLCEGCPSLGPCREWLDGLSRARRPRGVVAGKVVREPRKRPT